MLDINQGAAGRFSPQLVRELCNNFLGRRASRLSELFGCLRSEGRIRRIISELREQAKLRPIEGMPALTEQGLLDAMNDKIRQLSELSLDGPARELVAQLTRLHTDGVRLIRERAEERANESVADYYALFSVARTASTEEIVAAYKREAKVHHPDKGAKDAEYMTKLSRAVAILRDEEQRRVYDEALNRYERLHPGEGRGAVTLRE